MRALDQTAGRRAAAIGAPEPQREDDDVGDPDIQRIEQQCRAGAGTTLLLDALNIWVTNVIVFALWFWSTDRGGPPTCGLVKRAHADFLFPQMTLLDREVRDWLPGFVDYVFLAFTNATAFSPTDTLPLTQRAKLLMMAEAMISLLTIALVAARAVNILA